MKTLFIGLCSFVLLICLWLLYSLVREAIDWHGPVQLTFIVIVVVTATMALLVSTIIALQLRSPHMSSLLVVELIFAGSLMYLTWAYHLYPNRSLAVGIAFLVTAIAFVVRNVLRFLAMRQ